MKARLSVRRSLVHGAGLGLFSCGSAVEEGVSMGRLSGAVLYEAHSADEAEAWAVRQNSDRLVLLRQWPCSARTGNAATWRVVDVSGSVYEFVNCADSEEEANLHVSERGEVSAQRDICTGEELLWWYGNAFRLRG